MNRFIIQSIVFVFVSFLFSLYSELIDAQIPINQKDSLISAYESQLAETGILAQQHLSDIDFAIHSGISGKEKKRLEDSLTRSVQQYRQRGIHLCKMDQIWYSQVMPTQIAKVFGKSMSNLEKEYVKLKQLDCDIPLLTPSGELIDPKRILPRLLICDRILKSGSGALNTKNTSRERLLKIRSETEDLRTKCLFLIYFGTTKRTSTDPKTNIIKGEFWNPMYEFTRKYPNNASAKEMLQFIRILEANNYRLSPEIKENLVRFRSTL